MNVVLQKTILRTLAYLCVYLDGKNVSNRVPSAYILWLLDHLLHGIGDLVCGRPAVAKWVADPWRFDLESDPEHDQVEITLHLPPKWVAMKNCIVPLGTFGRAVLRLAADLDEYLIEHYPDEVFDALKGEQYRRFKALERDAILDLLVYETKA